MSEHLWDDDELYSLEENAPEDIRVAGAADQDEGPLKGDGATPFVAGHGYARRFPTECLPPMMRAYVHDIAERTQVPVDLPALVMLGMIGAATAPRMVIRASVEWTEPTNIYALCAMPSSAGKSPAVKELRRGAWRAERALREAHPAEVAEQIRALNAAADEMELDLNHRHLTVGLEEKAGIEARIKAIRAEVSQLASNPPPAPGFLLDGDTTPEALSGRLANSCGQGALVDDEGTLLRNLGGQYSGGKTGNLALFLKAYDADSYRPARVTRDAQPIDRLALGIVLAPQPSFLADMMRNGTMRDSGFVNRFIVSLPGDLIGRRSGRKSTFVDDATDVQRAEHHAGQEWWSRLLESLVDYDVVGSSAGTEIPELNLTREAYDMFSGYVEDFEVRLLPGRGDLAKVANWAGKHCGRVLRLSSALHWAAGSALDDRVEKETMANAIALGEWAIEHFTGMGRSVGLSTGARQVKEYLDGIPAGWCTRTDINNKVFKKNGTEDIGALIDELCATGEYLTEFLSPSGGRGRKLQIVRRVDAVVARP